MLEEYSVQALMLGLGADDDCKTTVDNGKHRLWSSYSKEIPINENREDCEFVELVVRGGAEYSVQTSMFDSDAGHAKLLLMTENTE